MTVLHSVHVHNHIGEDGLLLVSRLDGKPVTVSGVPMVMVGDGEYARVLPATGFQPTKAEALLFAALRAEQIGRGILAQAERLRAEARRQEAAA